MGGLVDHRVRVSNEGLLRPCCTGTGDWPGRPDISVSRQASFLSFLNYLRGMSVSRLAGAVGDPFAEAGFFETDFCFFDFGRQTAGLQAMFGLF